MDRAVIVFDGTSPYGERNPVVTRVCYRAVEAGCAEPWARPSRTRRWVVYGSMLIFLASFWALVAFLGYLAVQR